MIRGAMDKTYQVNLDQCLPHFTKQLSQRTVANINTYLDKALYHIYWEGYNLP